MSLILASRNAWSLGRGISKIREGNLKEYTKNIIVIIDSSDTLYLYSEMK